MSDANGRNASTIPAPADLAADMRELRLALERVGELSGKLVNRLTLLELATLTDEHKINVLAEHDKDHEARIRRLEGLDPEPAAQATAAE